ncbi:exopolyphosphatase [Nitrococcus mobilis]|uniref:Exopolyphosphatase n=1 Tax=Nitrococcus mobilis Nb-231 TaxID=314278 RepID=A4BPH4_9GAMM|nr:exopolyphosphatase [Nitrococcus mobilis]EAR22475.1 Exopolyphosphatase [Nitrococcus mobilis Nb-231]
MVAETDRLETAGPGGPVSDDATKVIAAVDLGSNSFHMKVARVVGNQLTMIDRMREPVRLAAGLNEHNELDQAARERALGALERFGQRLRDVPSHNVRAVGTNTFRRAHRATTFLSESETALGHPIEIIAGREEARLIYLGVARSTAQSPGKKLVVDIGGGSTELIIGRRFEPLSMESLYMGCVAMSREFFADGAIDARGMRRAVLAARQELEYIEEPYRRIGWNTVIGSSGTIQNVWQVIQNEGWSQKGITVKGLGKLRDALIETGRADKLKLRGLQPERAPVFAGGVAILVAVFESLKLRRMTCADGALREGLLYDLIGRLDYKDVRGATIDDLCQRYRVDQEQARRVAETAGFLLDRVTDSWDLNGKRHAQLLQWAARLHEIGLDIAHSQHHKHGAYILQNADLSGFSNQEQAEIAALVRVHRRKFATQVFDTLPRGRHTHLYRLAVLLRLAVVLHRGRYDMDLAGLEVAASPNTLSLSFPSGWLAGHPLTEADLAREDTYLQAAGMALKIA